MRVEREAQERKLETRRNSQAMLMGGLRLNFKTSQVLPSSNLQLFGFRQRRACRVGGGFVHDGFGQVVLTEERGKGSGKEWKYKMEGEVLDTLVCDEVPLLQCTDQDTFRHTQQHKHLVT